MDVTRTTCPFCNDTLQEAKQTSLSDLIGEFKLCGTCGWWSKNRRTKRHKEDGRYFSMFGAYAQLKTLNVADVQTPIAEVQQYLLAKYDERFNVHPRLFEDVVAEVFRSCGYSARVTAYSADGGIDVVLDNGRANTIGVQVKRYRNRILVEEIRAFGGALVLNGHTSGIFVTTSDYSRGSVNAADGFSTRGVPIELLDAERLYDALRISRLSACSEWDERDWEDWFYEIRDLDDQMIYEDEGPF